MISRSRLAELTPRDLVRLHLVCENLRAIHSAAGATSSPMRAPLQRLCDESFDHAEAIMKKGAIGLRTRAGAGRPLPKTIPPAVEQHLIALLTAQIGGGDARPEALEANQGAPAPAPDALAQPEAEPA